MGSTTESDQRRHSVNIEAFDLMDVPATFFQYDHYCEDVGKDKREDENSGRNDRPVIRVSYWDAVDFANWVTQKMGIAHRLPTEAEGEHACRPGTDTEFWWGDIPDPPLMNYDNDIGQAIPVKNSVSMFETLGKFTICMATLGNGARPYAIKIMEVLNRKVGVVPRVSDRAFFAADPGIFCLAREICLAVSYFSKLQ